MRNTSSRDLILIGTRNAMGTHVHIQTKYTYKKIVNLFVLHFFEHEVSEQADYLDLLLLNSGSIQLQG